MKIHSSTDINLSKIHFDGILHIAFVRKDFVSLQSWRDYEKFSIQLTFKDNASLILEYSNDKLWKAVLKELEGVLYP